MRELPALEPAHRPREEEFLAAKVFKQGMDWLQWARTRQPFALVVDSFDAHEPWDAPRNLIDIYGTTSHARGGADPAVPDACRAPRGPRPLPRSRCAGWPSSTPPRSPWWTAGSGASSSGSRDWGWTRTRSWC